jgi:hypothetical protein
LAIGIALVFAGLVAIAWYLYRVRAKSSELPSQIDTLPPVPSNSAVDAPASKANRIPRSPPPVPAPEIQSDPQRDQIRRLQGQAREAYAKGHYVEPAGTGAIAYSKQVLAIDPTDAYSKSLIDNGVKGVRYQVQQALARKDFPTAHRLANELAQLLPRRHDLAVVKEDIAAAEHAARAPHNASTNASQGLSFRVYHLHADKPPGENGPYCLGMLSASGSHLKFAAQSASDGQLHKIQLACSDIKDIKRNARVASRQGGFHVRAASGNYNFVPFDGSTEIVSALVSACSQ